MYQPTYSTIDDAYPEERILWREPDEIREEIDLVRELLRATQGSLGESERRREELLLALSDEGYEDHERIRELEMLCEECDEIKATLESLWERVDTLAEELEDARYFLRGGAA